MADRHRRARATPASPARCKQTAGAVGYVEQAYALQHNFTYASVKNKAGKFIAPTLASTTAAAEGVKVPANLGIKISNPTGPAPTRSPRRRSSSSTRTSARPAARAAKKPPRASSKFITYGLDEGQSILSQADYAGLPAAILAKSKEAAKALQCNGSPIGG